MTLRAVAAFDYAEAVATGTGLYGPKRAAIAPKKAKGLLVPVTSAPTLNGKPQAYIVYDGQMYVVRRSMKGTKANPYDQRAAQQREREASAIFDRALADELANGNTRTVRNVNIERL